MDSTNTRLIITKMVLENFKSYAGVQEIGPFHKRFSSIVGPNGSGKSNVIDALLFVFGKRANQLRLKKVSELIHKSSNFPNLEYARVSVYFQTILDEESSEDEYQLVPSTDFVVTRIAYTNNTSKYTLNDKAISSTDLAKMLKGHGIDLDNNRFLILQGEVEQIAMMKPKGASPHEDGLLEYLEDIIGSNKFIESIDETSKRMDELNEQRVEKVNRLKVVEKERDNLSANKEEAEEFIEKEKDIRRKKNTLYQCLENVATSNVKDFESRLVKVQEKLNYERGKVSDTESKLATIQKEYDGIQAEYNAVNAELTKSTEDYSAFERRDVKLQEDIKHSKTMIKKLQTALAKETKKEAECTKEAADLAVQINKYKTVIAEVEASKSAEEAAMEDIMDGLRDATAELRAKVEVSQANLAEAEKSVGSLQTAKEMVEMGIKLANSRSEKASQDIAALTEKINNIVATRAENEARLREIETVGLKDILKRSQKLQQTVHACVAEEQKLQQELRTAIVALEEAKAQLGAQQSSSKSSQNVVVQQILQAACKGGVLANAGVRGRLGDLATIDPKYDVAISTACGVLDYIVVDTTEGGQACINYLREHNLGRASFMVLSQVQQWEATLQKPIKTPENTPRLFDLAQCSDPAIKPALYMALRDTLVASNLETAVKIAYVGDRAAWRVVTLDGNLIDTSGAMSGGGKAVKSGGMRLTGKSVVSTKNAEDEPAITPAMIQKLEAKATSIQQKLTDCRERKAAAEKDLEKTMKEQQMLQTETEKTTMSIISQQEQEQELQTRFKSLQEEVALTPEEKQQVAENERTLKALDEEMLIVAPNLKTLQTEVASLQRQIMSVGGPKLAKCQSKIESHAAQLAMVASSLSTKEVEESTAQKQAAKAKTALAKTTSDMEKTQQKLHNLEAEQREMESDALAVVNAVEAATKQLSECEGMLKAKTKEYKELQAVISKVRAVEVDLAVEFERVQREIEENKNEIDNWHQQAEEVRKTHLDEQHEFAKLVESITVPSNQASSETKEGMEDGGDKMITDEESESSAASFEVLPIYPTELLLQENQEDLKRELNVLESERNKMKANVNMSALMEYMRKDANYKYRLAELESVTAARNEVRAEYEELRRNRLEAFMNGFGVISLKLKEMYQMITLGGDAELELLDSLDPFSEGIVFSVRPPKKSWKNISNLSGGEKTLSSLALVFALHHYKPTPLYVMDEIDAALDFKNVSIVANYIKDRTKNAQFVIISLRNNMFELADRLVGIYKTHDATKSVTINPKKFSNATQGVKPPPVVSAMENLPLPPPTTKASSGVVMPAAPQPLTEATNTITAAGR